MSLHLIIGIIFIIIIFVAVFCSAAAVPIDDDDRLWRERDAEHSTQVVDLVDVVGAFQRSLAKVEQRQKGLDRLFIDILRRKVR